MQNAPILTLLAQHGRLVKF